MTRRACYEILYENFLETLLSLRYLNEGCKLPFIQLVYNIDIEVKSTVPP